MKEISVAFASVKLTEEFEGLSNNKFEDKQLHKFISRAFDDLKQNPSCGIRIPKRLWPKSYELYRITNLWKYNLPNAWRLIYTIKNDDVRILSIILEWLSHKEYEKRFKY